MADQGSGIMKKTTVQSIYFSLFLVLSFMAIIGFAGALADVGIIDLEYLDQEIDNDNWIVIYGVLIVFVVLPIFLANFLTIYKMRIIDKKVE